MEDTYSVIIIGSGPAGLTAAIYAVRAKFTTLVFDGKNPGGQLMGTSNVENWPGEISIPGPQLMENMRKQAEHLGTLFESSEVTSVDFSKRPFTVKTSNQKTYSALSVIIATGAVPRLLSCPGENTYWGKGVTTCAVCDAPFYKNKKVVVVGGGDTAMEDVYFLSKYTKDVTIVHILDKFTASPSMQEKALANKNVQILFNTTVTEIKGDGSKVTGVVITDQKTKATKELVVDGVFIAIGILPKTDLFKGQLELINSGHIQVTGHTHTSVSGVFAAGDVTDPRYRQAITSAGAGCMAAMDAETYLKSLS